MARRKQPHLQTAAQSSVAVAAAPKSKPKSPSHKPPTLQKTTAGHSPACQDYFRDVTRTLAQPTLNVTQLLATQIPTPSLDDQRWIVTQLSAFQAKLDELERLQTGSAAELDALLPSILDRAFKGEL